MAGERIDFSAPTKATLAKRAGYRCSAPSCRVLTVGPSESSATGSSVVGVAAHVTAASKGGPRWDASLTDEQRAAPGNGVWLCEIHGKAVDVDTVRFDADLLHQWRRLAEERAHLEIMSAGRNNDERRLLVHTRPLEADADSLHSQIDLFLADTGVVETWGQEPTDIVRRALYEIGFNAIRHQGAADLAIETTTSSCLVRYDAVGFALEDLMNAERRGGGRRAVEDLSSRLGGTHDLTVKINEADTEWVVLDAFPSEPAPCTSFLDDVFEDPDFELDRLAGCEEVHLYAPRLLSYSDLGMWWTHAAEVLGDRFLVVHGLDPDSGLGQYLRELVGRLEFR